MSRANTRTANPTASGVSAVATTATAAPVVTDTTRMATQETKKKKATITDVVKDGGMYVVTYSTGSIKRVLIDKAPKTVISWLVEHPITEAAPVVVADPEPAEPETEMVMEPETIMESEVIALDASEPETEPTMEAAPIEDEIPVTVKPEPLRGTWPTITEMVIITGIRAAQIAIFALWLTIQLLTGICRAAEAVPVVIRRARAGCRSSVAEILTAYQTAREAAGVATAYTLEVITDTGRGFLRAGHAIRKAALVVIASVMIR